MDVIAERLFGLEDGSSIRLLVGRPQAQSVGFECVCQIALGEKQRTLRLHGEDGLQALILALGIAAVEIRSIAKRRGQVINASDWLDLERTIPPSAK